MSFSHWVARVAPLLVLAAILFGGILYANRVDEVMPARMATHARASGARVKQLMMAASARSGKARGGSGSARTQALPKVAPKAAQDDGADDDDVAAAQSAGEEEALPQNNWNENEEMATAHSGSSGSGRGASAAPLIESVHLENSAEANAARQQAWQPAAAIGDALSLTADWAWLIA